MARKLDRKGVSQAPSGRWGYRMVVHGRREYFGGFPTAEDAAKARDVKRGLLAASRGGYTPDPALLPTISELAAKVLKDREGTTSYSTHASRWRCYAEKYFGPMRPGEIDTEVIKRWAKDLRKTHSASTVWATLTILSAVFEDLRDEHPSVHNPCRNLPAKILNGPLKKTQDPTKTPFIRKLVDVRRIYDSLQANVARQYALGAYAGMRPAEARAVEWHDVDFDAGTILVERQVNRTNNGTAVLKGKKARRVPILDVLLPLLKEWHLADGGKGLLVKPTHDEEKDFLHCSQANHRLDKALADLGLARPGLGWYEATRHTFASQWVMAGKSMRKLSQILGHSSVTVTERYAHLDPANYSADDRSTFGSGTPNTHNVVAFPGNEMASAGSSGST